MNLDLKEYINQAKAFGPLSFEEENVDICLQTECFLCKDSFNLHINLPLFLRHVFEVHQLLVEDVQNINYLHKYVDYWREIFRQTPIEQIIPTVKFDTSDIKYFLLSTLIKKDKEMRHSLKLEYILNFQNFERTDTNFSRSCLFCRSIIEGTRLDLLEHLSSKHNLQLGNPQNLVYIEDLINKIETKLENLTCIYCERIFPDRNVLKEHMRKKLHKRINPIKREYDKYYIVNYLELDKDWKSIQKEDDECALTRLGNRSPVDENGDDEYFDWNEEGDNIVCLFCTNKEKSINLQCLHMEGDHDFDFAKLSESLNFYQKVKLVNYIRRQAHSNCCIFCNKDLQNANALLEHMREMKHFKLPDVKEFDQPEYYFPTYENDAFLYFLDDLDE